MQVLALRGGDKAARAQHGYFQDDYIILYQETFENNVMFRAGTLVHENWHYRTGYSHKCNDGDKDCTYYKDHWIVITKACQGARGCVVSKETVVNPNANQLNTYSAEARWYIDYHIYADQNTKTSLKNASLSLFRSRITNRIVDQSSVPSDIQSWL